MEEHTTDDEGDWSCEECSYQTNTEAHLNNHLKHSEHKTKFVCKLCESTFTTGNELSKHRTSNHKTFKPCKNLPNCQYKDDCLFNHKMLNIDTFICYECGYETKNLNHLMEHRKANHKMNTCRKFLQNKCIFNASSCWYNHNNRQGQSSEKKENESNDVEMTSPVKNKSYTQVFRNAPSNLAPPPPQNTPPPPPSPQNTSPPTPSPQNTPPLPPSPHQNSPSQATWVKMVSLMTELNQMNTMKQSQIYL